MTEKGLLFIPASPPSHSFYHGSLLKCSRRPSLPPARILNPSFIHPRAISTDVTTVKPRPITTTIHTFTDPRGRKWSYEADIVQPVPPSSTDPHRAPVIFMHTASGLGVNKLYWNPLLRYIEQNPIVLQHHPLARFEWVGTGDTGPKPDFVAEPYTADYFVAQLAHFASTFGQKVVLVAQGSSEPIVIRFAAKYPQLCKAVVFVTGTGTKYLTNPPNEQRRNLSYNFFTSFAGDRFWDFVANRRYMRGFSRKNLIKRDDMIEEWLDYACLGAQDRRVRFNVFSFIAGFLFEDYTDDLRNISAQCLFLSGTEKPDRSWGKRFRSARPPAPLVATESTFRDVVAKRMEHRCSLIPNAQGVIVDGAGVEILFEDVALGMPPLENFLAVHG